MQLSCARNSKPLFLSHCKIRAVKVSILLQFQEDTTELNKIQYGI